MFLLRKEVPYWRDEGLGALLALDFASPNTLEVIAWILAVHMTFPYLSTMLTLTWNAG
jgi:hypothetical protein